MSPEQIKGGVCTYLGRQALTPGWEIRYRDLTSVLRPISSHAHARHPSQCLGRVESGVRRCGFGREAHARSSISQALLCNRYAVLQPQADEYLLHRSSMKRLFTDCSFLRSRPISMLSPCQTASGIRIPVKPWKHRASPYRLGPRAIFDLSGLCC